MLDRRSVLRRGAGVLGTATLASAAGCLIDGDGGDSGNDGGGDDSDGDSDDPGSDSFLAVLPDARPSVVPNFHAAYDYDPVTLRNQLGADPMPELSGRLVANVGEMEGTTVSDLDGLSGQVVRQVGHPGGDLTFVTPRGDDLVARGSIDVAGAAEWLANQESLSELDEDRGYRRFGNDGQTIEGFAVDGGALTFGNRQGTDASADAVTTAAIDGLETGGVPAAATSPELVTTVDALPDGVATVATGFDLVAERPDTGTEAYDAAAASLLAAGVAASVGGQTTDVTRVLRYRRGRVADVESVEAAVATAVDDGHFLDGDWSVSADGRTVRIDGSVATTAVADAPASLRRAVPVPAYDDLTVPIDPTALGRDAPPRVAWQPSVLDDGRVAIVHAGGPTVEDLTVAYAVDDERVREPWEGPVEGDDRFETSQAPDAGSYLDLVWARETANETILFRSQLGGSS